MFGPFEVVILCGISLIVGWAVGVAPPRRRPPLELPPRRRTKP